MLVLGNDWDDILKDEIQKDYYLKIRAILAHEYNNETIYPLKDDVFNAFRFCSYNDTKVVILGQDPYMNPGEAHGLSFSVQKGVRIPPSLRNIFKELYDDVGVDTPVHGDLSSWAKQGVLLLNSILTVRRGQAGSHKGIGWEIFTDNVIRYLNMRNTPIVFMLWGRFAKNKEYLIENPIHSVLSSSHPSPLAGKGFSGCKHFSQANVILEKVYSIPINWNSINEDGELYII